MNFFFSVGFTQDNKMTISDVKPVIQNVENITVQGSQNLMVENFLGPNTRPNPVSHHSRKYYCYYK